MQLRFTRTSVRCDNKDIKAPPDVPRCQASSSLIYPKWVAPSFYFVPHWGFISSTRIISCDSDSSFRSQTRSFDSFLLLLTHSPTARMSHSRLMSSLLWGSGRIFPSIFRSFLILLGSNIYRSCGICFRTYFIADLHLPKFYSGGADFRFKLSQTIKKRNYILAT
jgi:hypothetical protein